MSRRLLWLVLSPGACTGANPLFDLEDDASGSAEASGTSPSGPSSGSDDGSATVKDDDDSGSVSISVSTTATTTTDVDADTGGMTTDATSETGGTCSVARVGEVSIDIEPAPTGLAGDCTGVWTSPQGTIWRGDETISVASCMCACPYEPNPDHTMTVTGVEVPDIGPCGYVAMWQTPQDGSCVWAGLAVFSGGSEPTWIVSRSPVVPIAIFGGLSVDRHPVEPCATGSCDEAGTYALEFVGADGDNVITMEEPPKTMLLPFYAALPYIVDDVNSVIDEGCNERIAWTATYDP